MGNHRVNPFARGTVVRRATRLRDALGRELCPGDLVMLPRNAPTGRLVQVAPMLAPNAPPNTVAVSILVSFVAPADEPIQDLMLVAVADDTTAAVAEREGGDPAPDTPAVALTDREG